MNIQPYYCTFEQAKLLKEKGFDGEYWSNGILRIEQWQVVEWLRVEKSIWVGVDVNINGFFANIIREWNKKDDAWEVRSIGHVKKHITPQEAYSAAFDYVLTKLI